MIIRGYESLFFFLLLFFLFLVPAFSSLDVFSRTLMPVSGALLLPFGHLLFFPLDTAPCLNEKGNFLFGVMVGRTERGIIPKT